jgi:hypothetical protein
MALSAENNGVMKWRRINIKMASMAKAGVMA